MLTQAREWLCGICKHSITACLLVRASRGELFVYNVSYPQGRSRNSTAATPKHMPTMHYIHNPTSTAWIDSSWGGSISVSEKLGGFQSLTAGGSKSPPRGPPIHRSPLVLSLGQGLTISCFYPAPG